MQTRLIYRKLSVESVARLSQHSGCLMLSVHFVGSTFDLCVQSRPPARDASPSSSSITRDTAAAAAAAAAVTATQTENCANWYICIYTRTGPDLTSHDTNSIAHYSSRLAAGGRTDPPTRLPVLTGNTWRRRAEVPTLQGGLTRKRWTSLQVGVRRADRPVTWRGLDARMVRKLRNDEKYYGLWRH